MQFPTRWSLDLIQFVLEDDNDSAHVPSLAASPSGCLIDALRIRDLADWGEAAMIL